MRRLQLIVALATLVVAGRARAQGVADLPSGARIRITLPDSIRQQPLMPETRIIVSHGVSRSRSAVQQALLLGAMVGMLRASTDDGDVHRNVVGFAALGAAFGGVLGALQPYEHWRKVR